MLFRQKKYQLFFLSILLLAAFFVVEIKKVEAAFDPAVTYSKTSNGQLSADEWNNLQNDFVRTWGSTTAVGGIGIGVAPQGTDINGLVASSTIKTNTSFLGALNASYITPGAFNSVAGTGGNFSFPANLGIGATPVNAGLHLSGADTYSAMFRLVNSSASGGQYFMGVTNSAWDAGGNKLVFGAGTPSSANIKMVLAANGNVGIGTTNPGGKFQISDIDKGTTSLYGSANLMIYTTDALAANKGGSLSLGGTVSGTTPFGLAAIKGAKENAISSDLNGYLALYTSKTAVGSVEQMRITSSGNVGIGTTSPGAKLQVAGSAIFGGMDGNGINISGTNESVGLRFSSSASGYKEIQSFESEPLYINRLGNNVILNATAGSVGIGTTAPAYKLDVTGDANFNDNYIHGVRGPVLGTDAANRSYVDTLMASTSAGIITQIATSSLWQGSLTGAIYSNNSGNVGIGTSTPSEKLEVVGKLKIGNNTVSGENITFDGVTGGGMRVANQYGYVNITPLNNGWAHIYTDRGAFIFNKPVYNIGGGGFSSYTNENLLLKTGGTTRITVGYANGNVGIGTTTPNAALDVFGNAKITNAGLIYNTDSSRWLDMTGTNIDSLRVPGDLHSTAGVLKADGAGNSYVMGKLGVGTNNPGATLDVVKAVGANGVWANFGYDGTNPSRAKIYASNWYGGFSLYDNTNNETIKLNTGGNSWIATTGNVGIGTTAPTQKLEVAGNIFMNTGYLMQTDTWGIKWKFAGDSDTVEMNQSELAFKFNIAGSINKYRFNTTKNGFGPILDLNTSGSSIFYGNVGIGTTTPGYKLDVLGEANFNGNQIHGVAAPVQGTDAANKSYVDSSITPPATTTAGIQAGFWTTGAAGSIYNNNSSGKVGIGTTNPGSMLTVGGADDKDAGPILNLSGSSVNQFESGRVRFTETTVAASPFYQGAFFHYDGSANTFNIGVHETADALQASDINSIRITRSNGSVNIGNGALFTQYNGNVGVGINNPDYPLTIKYSANGQIGLRRSDGNTVGLLGVDSSNVFNIQSTSGSGNIAIKQNVGGSGQLTTLFLKGSNGNVGINTTAPTQKLHVAGDASFLVGTSSPSQVHDVAAPTQGTDVANRNYVDTNFAPIAIVGSASLWATSSAGTYNVGLGNVGIGTTAPAGKLHVAGSWASTILTGDNIIVKKPDFPSGGGWARTLLSFQENDGTSYFQIGALGNNNTFSNGYLGAAWDNTTMRWYSNKNVVFDGNVGIGTTNPIEKLSITGGNAEFTNYAYQKFNIGNTKGYIWGNHDYAGALGNIFTDDITISANWQGVTSNTDNFASSNTAMGNSAVSIGRHGIRMFTALNNPTGTLPVQRMIIDNSGNVGIGTTAPTQKLHVAGDASFMVGASSPSQIHDVAAPTQGTDVANRNYVDTNFAPIAIVGSASLWATSSAGTYNVGLGNVGIGTTAPLKRLDVSGNFRMKDSSYSSAILSSLTSSPDFGAALYLGNAIGDGSNQTGIRLRATYGGVGTSGKPNFAIDRATNTQSYNGDISTLTYVNSLTIDGGNGNVGIGTTNPLKKLQVAQDLTYSQSQSGQLYLSSADGVKRLMLGYDSTNNFGFIEGVNFGTAYSNVVINPVQGNVGIGTTTPTHKLHVAGDGSFFNGASPSQIHGVAAPTLGTDAVNRNYVDTLINDSVSATDFWKLNGSNLYASSTAWNVGIGTTNPGALLHINATDAVTGSLIIGGGKNIVTAIGEINSQIDFRSNDASVMSTNQIGGRITSVTEFNNGANVGMGFYTYTQAGNLLTEKVRITNQGNVGIGTTNPQAKLHILQAIDTDGLIIHAPSTNSDGIKHYSALTFSEYADKTGNYSQIRNYSNLWSSWGSSLTFNVTAGPATPNTLIEAMRINPSGNVGIGTAAPVYKLDVAGEANFGGNQIHGVAAPVQGTDAVNRNYVDSNFIASTSLPTITNAFVQGGNSFGVKAILGTNDNQALGIETNGTEKMTILANGNVGVGTTAPTGKLEVNGNLIASSIRSVRQEADIAQGCSVSISGGNLVGGGPTYRTQNSYWQITAVGQILTLNCGGWWHSGMSFSGSNRYNVSGSRLPAGFTVERSIDGGTTWINVQNVSNNANNFYNVNLPDAPMIRIIVNSFQSGETQAVISNIKVYELDDYSVSEPFGYTGGGNVVHMGNNVGIGTTAPNAALDIFGKTKITNNGIIYNTDSSRWLDMTGVNADSLRVSGNLNSTAGALKIDGTGNSYVMGNLGIGTTNPGYKFDVQGGVSRLRLDGTGTQFPLYLWNEQAAAAGVGTGIAFFGGATNQAQIISGWNGAATTDSYLRFLVRGSNALLEALRINSSGNVGIGTTNPLSRLTVEQVQNAESLVTLRNNRQDAGNVPIFGISAQNSSVDVAKISFYRGSASSSGYLTFSTYQAGASLTEKVRITDSGNVGIGTTTPSTKLYVNGVVTATGGFSGPLTGTVNAANISKGIFGTNTGQGTYSFGGVTANGDSHYQWEGATYRNPGDYTPQINIRQDNATTGINGFKPALTLYNQNGDLNSTIGLDFAVRETTASGNATALAGIMAIKESAGTSGAWTQGGLLFYTKNMGTRVDALRIFNNGNVGIGVDPGIFKLKVDGNVAITGTLQTMTGSDFAEEFVVSSPLEAGTVVVMGDLGYKSVKACNEKFDSTVVGVVSDNPSIIAGRVDSKHKAVVAMAGVVKVKVSATNGKIKKGTMLTTSNISGYAMKADNNHPGTIIGKALENLTNKQGEIKVLINLQ